MDIRLIPPVFPRPSATYSEQYMADLVRALTSLVTYVRAVGEGRQTTIVLTNLATNDSGLEPGTIFQVEGVLRIPLLYSPYAAGLSATGSVGSVTVTT
jgi:hypothetical protein